MSEKKRERERERERKSNRETELENEPKTLLKTAEALSGEWPFTFLDFLRSVFAEKHRGANEKNASMVVARGEKIAGVHEGGERAYTYIYNMEGGGTLERAH